MMDSREKLMDALRGRGIENGNQLYRALLAADAEAAGTRPATWSEFWAGTRSIEWAKLDALMDLAGLDLRAKKSRG